MKARKKGNFPCPTPRAHYANEISLSLSLFLPHDSGDSARPRHTPIHASQGKFPFFLAQPEQYRPTRRRYVKTYRRHNCDRQHRGCGGRCSRRHDIVLIQREATS